MSFNAITYPNRHASFLQGVNAVIDRNLYDPDFSTEDLCQALCLCRMQIHRKLKSATGLSTSLYIRFYRLEAAKEQLNFTDKTIAEIAYNVGFSSPSYFTRSFVSEYGMTPSDFRMNGNGW